MISFRLAAPAEAELIHSITQDAWEEYRFVPGSSSVFDETVDQVRSTLESGEHMAVLGFLGDKEVLAVRLRLTDHLYFSRLGVRSACHGRGYGRMSLA